MPNSQVNNDFNNIVNAGESFPPQTVTGVATGSQVDLIGAGAAYVILSIGNVTDGSYTIVVQESNTSSSGQTDVAAASLSGAFTVFGTAGSSTTQVVGYQGNNRYINTKVKFATLATTGAIIGTTVVQERRRKQGSNNL